MERRSRRGLLAATLVSGVGVVGYPQWTDRSRTNAPGAPTSLRVGIDEMPESVHAGEHVRVRSVVENHADSPVETTVDLVVGHDPELDGRWTVTLAPGEARSVAQGFETFPVPDDQSFPVRVRVDGDEAERTLDVIGAQMVDGVTPSGSMTVAPDTGVLFEVDVTEYGDGTRVVWWTDGDRVGDSIGPWEGTYAAETGVEHRVESFDEIESTHVAAAILPGEGNGPDDGDGTYTVHWDIEVDESGATAPSIDRTAPVTDTVSIDPSSDTTFELDVSDEDGALDRVVWWLTQADTILAITSLDGEVDTAQYTLPGGGGVCDTCHVIPWVICADGRMREYTTGWELRDASMSDGPGQATVTILETNAPVDAGAVLELVVEVRNGGDSPIDGELVLLVGEDRDRSDTQAVSVEPGDVGTATLGFETYPVRNDDRFVVRVEGAGDADETTVLVRGRE